MQTTDRNDSMMSDFFQVDGFVNFSPTRLNELRDQVIAKAKEKQRQEALEIKRIIEEEERVKQEIINEQNVLNNSNNNSNNNTSTPPATQQDKTPYLWIGLGAVVLVGVTILIVKKS